MTWEELKAETYKLLQEYVEDEDNLTDDEDIANNVIPATNKILFELARAKKIETYQTMTVTKDQILDLKTLSNYYQLKAIRFKATDTEESLNEFVNEQPDYDIVGNYITFNKDGQVTIYYYRYPTLITEETNDNFELELDMDALNIAPTGIAGTILMTDISNQYGSVFLNQYQQMLQVLDSRTSDSMVMFEGGI